MGRQNKHVAKCWGVAVWEGNGGTEHGAGMSRLPQCKGRPLAGGPQQRFPEDPTHSPPSSCTSQFLRLNFPPSPLRSVSATGLELPPAEGLSPSGPSSRHHLTRCLLHCHPSALIDWKTPSMQELLPTVSAALSPVPGTEKGLDDSS